MINANIEENSSAYGAIKSEFSKMVVIETIGEFLTSAAKFVINRRATISLCDLFYTYRTINMLGIKTE